MRANVRLIEIFVRVVEAESFVGAARSMLIDPAAVSRAIKSLEGDLGILLFALDLAPRPVREENTVRGKPIVIGSP